MSCFSLVPFFMLGICCAGAWQETCQGSVGNTEVYAPFGSWLLLNCTHNCTIAVWESRLTKRNTAKGPGWVSVQVEVGTGADTEAEAEDWKASNISCIVLSVGVRDHIENYVNVIPYEIPRLVTIDMEDLLEEGKSYNVTCTVHGVAPIQNLMVSVFRGEEVIHQKSFRDYSRDGNITQVVTCPMTAHRSDNMKDFSCQATLVLGTVTGNVTVQSSSVAVQTFGKNTWSYVCIVTIVFIGLTVAALLGSAGIVVFLCKRKGKKASYRITKQQDPLMENRLNNQL